jgi:hypothetical protein
MPPVTRTTLLVQSARTANLLKGQWNCPLVPNGSAMHVAMPAQRLLTTAVETKPSTPINLDRLLSRALK